ncbi:MAG: hypothetical protein R3314_13850 [Longimicrobiales bacterium]|nr:hypothetical protein [Longimicrobiales bacterium]
MTRDEAKELIRGAILDESGDRMVGTAWGDFGAGSGTFTFALAELLGPDGRIVAVDRELAAVDALRRGLRGPTGEDAADGEGRPGSDAARVLPVRGDFRDPTAIRELRYTALDGALFGNALHFDPDPGSTLRRVADGLTADGRLVVIEYQDRPPNPWVPHPLPLARLEDVAAAEGLGAPTMVGEQPSSYGGTLYCAWLEVS